MDFESWNEIGPLEASLDAVDEQPTVVLQDVLKRPRPAGHVIVFANEKGGVGKSTLALHCAVTLAHRGKQVLAIDCDRRQQSMEQFFIARDGSARALQIDLPAVHHVRLAQSGGAQLAQEIERCGTQADFIVIDLPGHDSPLARRALAMADTLVTPVGAGVTELASLATIDRVNNSFRRPSPFAELVTALRSQREECDRGTLDWIVLRNRLRRRDHALMEAAQRDLATMAETLTFRLAEGLPERIEYRKLLSFGLIHLDLPQVPQLGRIQARYRRELDRLIDQLELPERGGSTPPRPLPPGRRATVLTENVRRYASALKEVARPLVKAG